MKKHIWIFSAALVSSAALIFGSSLLATQNVSGQPTAIVPPDTYKRPVRIAFLTGNFYDGDLGGLEGANAICNNSSLRPLKNIKYRAYLNASDRNVINRTFEPGADKILIASNRDEVGPTYEDIGLKRFLWTIGSETDFGSYYWSGNDGDGWNEINCNKWTTNSPTYNGGYSTGLSASGNPTTSDSNNYISCDTQFPILCVEWTE